MLATPTLLLGITPQAVLPGGATEPGDVEIVGEIAFDRERGCPICHVLPAPDAALHSDMGPSRRASGGLADRLSEGQPAAYGRRDPRQPVATMPAYYRLSGLTRVAVIYAAKPGLAAPEIEDLVAYLMTLRVDKR